MLTLLYLILNSKNMVYVNKVKKVNKMVFIALGLLIYRMFYIIHFIDEETLTNIQLDEVPFPLGQKLPVCLVIIRPSHSIHTLQKYSRVIINRISETIAL